MVAPLIGAGIRAAGAAARGLAKKFGKKTEEPRERFKSSYDKAKEAEDKIKAAAEKREKIKEGVKTAAKKRQKPQVLQELLAQPISLVRVCRHRKLAL
jgi:formyltetrahydrofolate synthetase